VPAHAPVTPEDGVLASALLVASAAALLVPPSPGSALQRRSSVRDGLRPRPRIRAVPAALLLGGMAGAALLPAGSRVGATTLPLASAGLVATATGGLLLRRRRAAGTARTRRAAVIEACDALAAGLRAGQPAQRVLDRVSADVDLLRPAAAAGRLGGDVATALRASAGPDGTEGLRLVAAAWAVAQRSGAGLADVVARIAAAVRADAEQRRQVEVALGTSRSTARLLAGLPALGVVLGSGLDADPLAVLLGTPAGAWCLFLGVTLGAVGLLWVERLADGALR
jgi:tight adherence protein B